MTTFLLAAAMAATLGTSAPAATLAQTSTPSATLRSAHAVVADTAAAGVGAILPETANHRPTTDLGTISVTAALDRARNSLSPETGSSQYVIDQQAIKRLPLGAATPLNQVILQAPGVVQDSYGQMHVRGDHGNLQYRINGVLLPESIGGFGQALDVRTIQRLQLLDGALPAQYGERTAAVVDITTKNGHTLGNGGDVGITGGTFGALNPHASWWGSQKEVSWFVTANYQENAVGIQNPTPRRDAIHDHTHQLKAFGDLAWIINPHMRLNFLFGAANNRFEIPDNPNQIPQFGYLGRTDFDSATLDERQKETTRFAIVSLQGTAGQTDYQVALGHRYSALHFVPDVIGDLMFNGVSSRIDRAARASTVQADFATPLGADNTLRYGLYGQFDAAGTADDSWAFPADSTGAQTSTTPLRMTAYQRVVAKTWAAYIQDEWMLGDDWTVNYGLRGDVYKAFGVTQSQLSPRFGVIWQAGDDTTVHAGYARYFTPPATELISSKTIARFDGTTHAIKNDGNNTPLPERSNYYDVGVLQHVGEHLTLGLDAYYRQVRDIQDEGQFGAALVYATFNYRRGNVKGMELTVNYDNGPWTAYFNLATTRAMGKEVVTSQYNVDAADLAYIREHWILLDHDQKLTSSGGAGYAFSDGTRLGADYLFGSGLRRDGAVPNGASMPAYFQLNLSASHDFKLGRVDAVQVRLAVINALDRVYALHDGTGIGVGAPQFGSRRGVYLGINKDF